MPVYFRKGHIPWNKGKHHLQKEQHWNWKGGNTFKICQHCNKRYNIKRSEINTRKFCSYKCYWKDLKGKQGFWINKKRPEISGKLNNKWKGGISSINDKIRKSGKYNSWRLFIYKKYNWTCQLCKRKCQGGNIVAHHIKEFSQFPKLRFNKDNGIVYCRACHRKIHAKLNKLLCQK